jgi:hypothetical protein
MAFYEDKVERFCGALVLSKRNLSVAVLNAKTHRKPAWHMRLKIGGRKGYPSRQPHPSCPKAAHSDRSPASPRRPSSAYIVKRCRDGGRWETACRASVQLGVGGEAPVDCYTKVGRCVCVLSVKSGDLRVVRSCGNLVLAVMCIPCWQSLDE